MMYVNHFLGALFASERDEKSREISLKPGIEMVVHYKASSNKLDAPAFPWRYKSVSDRKSRACPEKMLTWNI